MITPELREQAIAHLRARRDGHEIMGALLTTINKRETADTPCKVIEYYPGMLIYLEPRSTYPWSVMVEDGIARRGTT